MSKKKTIKISDHETTQASMTILLRKGRIYPLAESALMLMPSEYFEYMDISEDTDTEDFNPENWGKLIKMKVTIEIVFTCKVIDNEN